MQNDNSLTAINANLHIHKSSLEQLINQQVDEAIAKMPPQQLEFGKVRVEKKGELSFDMSGQKIALTIPLKIYLEGESFLSLFKAQAEIALSLETALTFQENWELFTITKLNRYQWINKPDVQLSVFNLSVENIADQLLHRFKGTIEKQIDKGIQKAWASASAEQKARDFFAKAHQLNSKFPIYIHLLPEQFQLSPVKHLDSFIKTTVNTILGIELNDSDRERLNLEIPSPSFEEATSNEQSYFNVNVDLAYPVLEQLMKTQLVGQSFSYKDYEISFSEIQLKKTETGLELIAKIKGYMEGEVNLICLPTYEETLNLITMQIQSFQLNVDSFWKRNLASLFSGIIKQEMQKRLRLKLDDILLLPEIKKLEDFSPQDGVQANIKMTSISLRKFIVGKAEISCVLVVAATIAITLLGNKDKENEEVIL